MKRIVEKYADLPKPIRRPLWRVWHNLIRKLDTNKEAVFMNYGFASENGQFKNLNLKSEDERDRYSIQLYDFVVKNHNVKDSNMLEVGSGRGGGASFITRYYQPKSYIGLDISKNTIEFCNEYFKNVKGLSFIQGTAEDLPFENEKFDALVNVESARCYKDIEKFFNEVHRVLKPGGKFLFADMIKKDDVRGINEKLERVGFKKIEEVNIRENVVRALQFDSENRAKTIDNNVPKLFRKSFYQFAGVVGTERYNSFYNSSMDYWSFTLEK